MRQIFFLILITFFFASSHGQTSNGLYSIKWDKFSFNSKICDRLYPAPDFVDTFFVKISIPRQIDSVVYMTMEGEENRTVDTIDCFTYNKLIGYIDINYLDTLIKKEIVIIENNKKLKIDQMSINIWRYSGNHYHSNVLGGKISQNKSIIDFLKKDPINSYLVIEAIWFYDLNTKRQQTMQRFAWKIITKPK